MEVVKFAQQNAKKRQKNTASAQRHQAAIGFLIFRGWDQN
jgi:hypothetical protein